MRLSQFIFCFLDGNYNNLVADSFHNTATHVYQNKWILQRKRLKIILKKKRKIEKRTRVRKQHKQQCKCQSRLCQNSRISFVKDEK
jgi:hypothetical protein